MTGAPRVSVVIPAFNAERFIAASVNSVLAQSMPDLECIVVDDGSTDSTRAIADSLNDPRVRVVCQPNSGTVSAARNRGIGEARAALIAFLDADDVWLPTKLEKQVRVFERHPELGLVFCAYAIASEDLVVQTIVWPKRDEFDFRGWMLLERNGIAPSSTALVRSSVFDDVGRYRLELSVSEDCDMAERIAQRHPVDAVNECLVLYRCHPGQGHVRLDRFQHDVQWILADRFGADGERDRRSWRRGTANLYTRLAYYELRNGDRKAAARRAIRAAVVSPVRPVLLPMEAMVRRVRRRIRFRRSPSPGSQARDD